MEIQPFCLAAVLASVFLAGCGGGSGSKGSETDPLGIDACAIVTQEEATNLFGVEATREPDDYEFGYLLGQCHWTWDTETENQLLQFYVWEGEEGYGVPSDSEPLAVGDEGNIRVVPPPGQALIDITWLQSSRTIVLDYSAIGSDPATLDAKVDAMKALAESTSAQLESK